MLGIFHKTSFVSDGNVWIGVINKNRKVPTEVIQVAFTSGSKTFLEGLCNMMKVKEIGGGSIFTSKMKNFSRLQLSTLDTLKLPEIMYNVRRTQMDTICGGSSTG